MDSQFVLSQLGPGAADGEGNLNGQAGDIMHKQGLSIGKVKEIFALWRENCKEFPEKRPAQLVKLTADQAGVDFVDVVWIIIENSQKTEGVKN